MAKNFNTNTDNNPVWLTPPSIIQSLGEFDLDPCSPINRPWDTAKHHYTIEDDGLSKEWFGRVWHNPPYGRELGKWLKKMAEHKNGISLIFARTETKAFQDYIFPHANSIHFIGHRLKFFKVDGTEGDSANAPSVLISYDEMNSDAIADSGIKGHHVYVREKIFFFGVSKEDNRTWKIIVGEALEELKQANLNDIYEAVMKMAPTRIQKNPNYKAKIRQTLQNYYNRLEVGRYSLN